MKTMSAGNAAQRKQPHAAICVDMGTTNTRAWLVVEQAIVARQSASIGVRDSARTGSTNIIHSTLKELFGALQADAQ